MATQQAGPKKIEVHKQGIVASYEGGDYIELRFAGHVDSCFEVVGVAESGGPKGKAELRKELSDWLADKGNVAALPDYRMSVGL